MERNYVTVTVCILRYLYLLQCTQNMVGYLPDSQLTPVYSAGHVHVYWLEL